MGAPVLLLALTLFPVAAAASLEPHYMVVFPAVIHHSQEEKLCIHLSSLTEAVHLAVTLEVATQNHTLVEKDVEKPGTFQCITFQVPEFIPRKRDDSTSHPENVVFLHVLIHSGDNVHFEGHKKVLVEPQKNVILVETDKGLYKPGETVKFRIVNLDEDLKVIKNEYSHIWLQDPEHNRIAEWLNVKSRHGIVDLSFPLASEAPLGKYTISVQQDMAQKTFRVHEYVLKKFEIEIEHPPFITTADEEFQLKVCGKYTYGKPVQGKISIYFVTSFQFLEGNISSFPEVTARKSRTDKNGCTTFTVKTESLELDETTSYIVAIGRMVENGTGAKAMEAVEIAIATRMKSIEFINLHSFYKRGLPYTGKMFCHSQNSPLKNETVYLTVDINEEETHLPFLTDENGEVHFSLDTTSWNSTLVSLKGTYNLGNDDKEDSSESHPGVEDSFHWLKPFYSESNSFLEIKARDDVMPCDQEQEVQVDYILDWNKLSSEADHIEFYYLMIAKGKILFSGEKQVTIIQHENLQGSFSLTLTVGNDFLPDIKLLVYAVFLDGDVVADVEEFQVEKCFRHKVALDFSHKETVPGSKVNLDLKAASGSLCSVQAVDKSVLLRKNNTLTADKLYEKVFDDSFTIGGRGFPYHLEDFEAYPCLPQQSSLHKKTQMGAPWYQSDADVFNLFKKLRMKILTNTRIKKPVSCILPGFEKKIGKDNVVENLAGHSDSAPQSDNTRKPEPRILFPETWIWDLVSVGDDGQASVQVAVPDTITEWNANAFCVANTGFGLSPLTTLRVFKPFFVDLSLPYSVIQGETFRVKATVFNYLKDCIQVRTTLTETPELKVDACPDCRFTSCLCADEAKTFKWNMTATRLGKVNVTVSSVAEDSQDLCDNRIAVTPLQGERDTVIKPLLVKPGGVLQEKTQNAFLCAEDNTVSEEFSLTLPAEVLEGSGRATFSVIGDIMGPALQNLDQLLELPFGCGEQNMVQFAPNIFILQYLNKTKQLDPEIEEKALKFLRTGYQRQLLYKHDDGSYSAFGKGDDQGNTWLTAFVARSFGQASSHIYINNDHVHNALLWLQKHQLPSGCFQSVGKLFNNDLKGGVDDTISLTAYITAALVELHLEKNDTMLDNALHCLKNVTLDKTSLYVKALMAYVFTLSKDVEMREQLLDMLEKETAEFLTSHSSREGSSSSMIETVAYILLAHVSKPDLAFSEASVSKLVHWLSGQRNAFGGFASTQDTVVSLQALAQYAALIPQEIRDVKVTVKSKEASPLEFHVHRNNKLVLHQASLLAVPGMYTVQATGSGCVYVQTTLYYNTPPPKTEEVFVLDVETVRRECDGVRKEFDIHVSVSYVGDRETTNMALVEVEMLSGFIPVKSSVKALEKIPLVKKTEIIPDKVTIYLEELGEISLKLNISVEQDVEVQNLKAATVHVYDYYKPDDHAAREYVFPCGSGPAGGRDRGTKPPFASGPGGRRWRPRGSGSAGSAGPSGGRGGSRRGRAGGGAAAAAGVERGSAAAAAGEDGPGARAAAAGRVPRDRGGLEVDSGGGAAIVCPARSRLPGSYRSPPPVAGRETRAFLQLLAAGIVRRVPASRHGGAACTVHTCCRRAGRAHTGARTLSGGFNFAAGVAGGLGGAAAPPAPASPAPLPGACGPAGRARRLAGKGGCRGGHGGAGSRWCGGPAVLEGRAYCCSRSIPARS
ncbi:alpha-2-macroglobulin-like protein 1 [Nyctibius grandis]|uniref:alpha-2-macroglobulin-like protein 1 n=1 Tax=Nyctibius grandis TaxID=48427 RepID=UPI0035BBBA71